MEAILYSDTHVVGVPFFTLVAQAAIELDHLVITVQGYLQAKTMSSLFHQSNFWRGYVIAALLQNNLIFDQKPPPRHQIRLKTYELDLKQKM